VTLEDMPRFATGSAELDRVLGGGIVPGSMVLIVGDPGIGKSSLTLKVCADTARQGKTVLYVTGEESTRQVRMRADRLGAVADRLFVVSETNLETIEAHIKNVKPDLMVIDSIQTIFKPDVQSAPGSVSQVRECAVELLRIAKTSGIAAFVVGHVTKDGTLAGPRVLEHIVDTVLYFEGQRNAEYRVLRAVKNRFGSTNEMGMFEMRDCGLVDVPDASKLFLSEKQQDGTVIMPMLEGTRPLLVEVQALVAPTPYVPPRRTADSVDIKRVQLLLAVLEKRVHLSIGACDVYIKVSGGIRVDEPAADLGICVAMASSFAGRLLRPQTIVFGEVGLSGEVRAVNQADVRVKEAKKLGFTNVVLPKKNCEAWHGDKEGINLYGAENISDALRLAMPKSL
jgi:DNA repair protein RadA/Sms